MSSARPDSPFSVMILPALTSAQKGLLLLLLGAFVDSSAGLFTKLIHADSFTMASARGFVAFFCLFFVFALRDQARMPMSLFRIGWPGIAFAIINGFGMFLTILSLRTTSVANFFMILGTAPLVAGVAGWLVLKEKLDISTGLAALAGFIGIVIMMSGKGEGASLTGDLIAVACVGTYSCIVLITRGSRFDILPVIMLTCLVSAILPLPFSNYGALTLADSGLIGIFGVLQIAIGNMIIFAAVRRIPPAQGGLLGVFNAAMGPLWVFFALGEVPSEATMIGGGIVITAAILHLAYTLTRKSA